MRVLEDIALLAAAATAVTDGVDVTGEVDHLVGEAPLIVIPCNELYEVAVESDTGLCVEDGGVLVGAEVGGNDLVVNIL